MPKSVPEPRACSCDDDALAVLYAEICNRGTDHVGAGAGVVFRDGDAEVCRAEAGGILDPGECDEASCTWTAELGPPVNETKDVDIEVDPDRAILECREGNNAARIEDVGCVTIE